MAEAEISYAGHQAESRARLAGEIVQRRIGAALKLRIDLVGSLSVFGDDAGRMAASHHASEARDIRLRVAAAHEDRHVAERVLREVTALYCCGPAGGGGVRTSIRQRLNMVSTTIDRAAVRCAWHFLDEAHA